jgi:hypothetical protein
MIRDASSETGSKPSSVGGSSDVLGGSVQTDAAISAGNSNGPLFNAPGEVMKYTRRSAIAGSEHRAWIRHANQLVKTRSRRFDTIWMLRPLADRREHDSARFWVRISGTLGIRATQKLTGPGGQRREWPSTAFAPVTGS